LFKSTLEKDFGISLRILNYGWYFVTFFSIIQIYCIAKILIFRIQRNKAIELLSRVDITMIENDIRNLIQILFQNDKTIKSFWFRIHNKRVKSSITVYKNCVTQNPNYIYDIVNHALLKYFTQTEIKSILKIEYLFVLERKKITAHEFLNHCSQWPKSVPLPNNC
jgi:hypothetical protein